MDIDKDPNNFADDGGPKGSRKRLYIPPYLFCAEAEDDVTENFHSKSVATTSKGKEMSAQERGSLVEECKKGFKELARVSADDSTEALPRNAVTNLGSESVGSEAQLLMEQAERRGLIDSPQRRVEATESPSKSPDSLTAGPANRSPAAKEVDTPRNLARKEKEVKVLDIATERVGCFRTLQKLTSDMEKN